MLEVLAFIGVVVVVLCVALVILGYKVMMLENTLSVVEGRQEDRASKWAVERLSQRVDKAAQLFQVIECKVNGITKHMRVVVTVNPPITGSIVNIRKMTKEELKAVQQLPVKK